MVAHRAEHRVVPAPVERTAPVKERVLLRSPAIGAAAIGAHFVALSYHRGMPHDRYAQGDAVALGDPLGPVFFARDPNQVASDLLGCLLVARTPDGVAGGIVVEAEAYLGAQDPGSHASTRDITKRNSVMYAEPGTVYVYLAYGCHRMLNLVCHAEEAAGAVLIRALEPTVGLDIMRERRVGVSSVRELCRGPGKLCSALAIELLDNGTALGNGRVAVYDCRREPPGEVAITGRVGLSEGHELEYRYYLKHSVFVSRGRLGPSRRRARAETEEGLA